MKTSKSTDGFASRLKSCEARLKAVEDWILDCNRATDEFSNRLSAVESFLTASPDDHVSVVGYARMRGYDDLDLESELLLEERACVLSHLMGCDIKKVSDSRFGKADAYHLDVLERVFDDWLAGDVM